MKNMKRAIVFALFAFSCTGLFALDFGAALAGHAEYSNYTKGKYAINLLPWLSWVNKEGSIDVYVSANLGVTYSDSRKLHKWKFIPDLKRTQITFSPTGKIDLEAGRLRFADNAGLAASGLFDGLRASFIVGPTRLKAAAFYTGLLNAESASITLSKSDSKEYADEDNYFAPRRIMAVLTMELPSFPTERSSLSIEGVGQFDLRKKVSKDRLNSEYVMVNFSIAPISGLNLKTSFGAGFVQYEGDNHIGFAATLGGNWAVPGRLRDELFLTGRWSSGAINDTIGSYLPVTIHGQGKIFNPNLSALMAINGGYSILPIKNLLLKAEGNVFFRTDTTTFREAELDRDSKSRFLGGEFFVSLMWAPLSDIMANVGGGMFFPGGAFKNTAKNHWLITGTLIVSF